MVIGETEVQSVTKSYLHPTVDVRCSSTAPAIAAPSEVDVPRPNSSSATCACSPQCRRQDLSTPVGDALLAHACQ